MTAADWFDLMTAAMGNTATYYALFWTLVSGYLVVAYTVGNKLMRNQIAFINTLFVISTLFTTFAAVTALRNGLLAFRMGATHVEEMTAITAGQAAGFVILVACVNFVIVLGCMKFMWDVRHPKSE